MWIEVAYAVATKQLIKRLEVPANTSVAQAIACAGIEQEFPELVILPDGVGIFSKPVSMEHILSEGDRVEIYRPLIADPKEARKERAKG